MIIFLAICPCLHRVTFPRPLRSIIEAFLLSRTIAAEAATAAVPGRQSHDVSTLSLLQEVEVDSLKDGGSAENSGILGFFKIAGQLPAVHSFRARFGYFRDPIHVPLSPRTSNIKRIVTTEGAIDSVLLVRLIVHCKALEEFSYRTTTNRAAIFPKSLEKALRCHRQTLRKLDLEIEHVVTPEVDIPEDWQFPDSLSVDNFDAEEDFNPPTVQQHIESRSGRVFGSLHGFTALTHLSIDVAVLLGWFEEYGADGQLLTEGWSYDLLGVLPSCLEYLHLRWYRFSRRSNYGYRFKGLQEQCSAAGLNLLY
jgi:hypothetical protein